MMYNMDNEWVMKRAGKADCKHDGRYYSLTTYPPIDQVICRRCGRLLERQWAEPTRQWPLEDQ